MRLHTFSLVFSGLLDCRLYMKKCEETDLVVIQISHNDILT